MKRDDMPPVPRDYKEARYSELVPIKSGSINVLKSPIFYMVLITAFLTLAMFGYMSDVLDRGSLEAFGTLVYAIIAYLLAMVLLVIYVYSRTDKPFWAYLTNLAFVALVLATPPLLLLYFLVFREILPGGQSMTGSQSFGNAFVGMFFGAGLCEELIKVTLVLFGAYVAVNAAQWRPRLTPRIYDLICIRGPLDGLLMGMFGGAGFILLETGNQYVWGMATNVAQQTGNDAAGLLAGLMLLLPRTIGGAVGHMGWAGITGYFIGLSVIRPTNALKMIAAAWIGVSLLHAAWNTQSFIPMFGYLSAGVTGVFLVACLLKARQLEMAMGRSVETYGSIIVHREPAASAAPPNPPPAAVAAPAAAPAAAIPAAAAPAAAAPASAAAGAPHASASAGAGAPVQLRLVFENATVPVALGQALDLGAVPALGASAANVKAEVTQHPVRTDVLGLKNLGTTPWVATLRDGSQQRIVPERNIRLADGVKIDFGDGLVAEVLV